MTIETCKKGEIKTLKEKINVCLNEPEYESCNNSFDMEYFLIEGEYEGTEQELTGTRIYGIEIVKKIKDDIVEQDSIKDFSSSKERTMQALKLLRESKVTPVTFKEILEDIIA